MSFDPEPDGAWLETRTRLASRDAGGVLMMARSWELAGHRASGVTRGMTAR